MFREKVEVVALSVEEGLLNSLLLQGRCMLYF